MVWWVVVCCYSNMGSTYYDTVYLEGDHIYSMTFIYLWQIIAVVLRYLL